MTDQEIAALARAHATALAADVRNAKDRIEHIRLTAFALEAHRIATALESRLTLEPSTV